MCMHMDMGIVHWWAMGHGAWGMWGMWGMGSGMGHIVDRDLSSQVDQLEAEADVSKQLAASSSTGEGSSFDSQVA